MQRGVYVGPGLTGKTPRCDYGEQGSPDSNRERGQPIRLGVRVTCSFPFLSERQVADDRFQFKSESRTLSDTGLQFNGTEHLTANEEMRVPPIMIEAAKPTGLWHVA